MLDSRLEYITCEYFIKEGNVIITQPLLEGDNQIWYTGVDNRQHTWFPDIKIIETGALIEVKALDTISLYRNKLNRNYNNLWTIMNYPNAELILISSYRSELAKPTLYHLRRTDKQFYWKDMRGNINSIVYKLKDNKIFITE